MCLILWILAITGCIGPKINYGPLLRNSHVKYVKLIKKPKNCIDLEQKVSDSLNVKIFNKRYLELNENEKALYFFDREIINSNEKSNNEIGYLVVFDKNCEIVEIISHQF